MKTLFTSIILFFILAGIFAQENHYWEQQPGAIPSMIGGASTANARDNSAIYYNPGGLAFVENSSLSLVGDAFTIASLNIVNGAGEGLDLKSFTAATTPQIVSGIIKVKNKPDLSITYVLILNSSSFINTNVSHDMYYDVLPDIPGDEIYVANYDYYNKIREDWLGVGMGRKLGEYFGIGFSYFLTLRSQELSRSYAASALDYQSDIETSSILASSSFREVFDYRNLGMLLKLGLNYDKENLKLGLNITSPKLSMEVFTGNLRRDQYSQIPSVPNNTPLQSTDQSKVPTVHKLPLQLDLGANFEFSKNTLSGRIGYSFDISPYKMLKPDPPQNEIQEILVSEDEKFNNMQDAGRDILNFGLGYIRVLKEGWAVLCGYRTDFNYFDDQVLSRQENYVPTISYWDLHHVSGGFTRYGKRYFISLGLSYGFGRSKGFQEINLTAPTTENNLFGVRDQSAYAKYNQFIVNLGFTYLFDR